MGDDMSGLRTHGVWTKALGIERRGWQGLGTDLEQLKLSQAVCVCFVKARSAALLGLLLHDHRQRKAEVAADLPRGGGGSRWTEY